MDENKKTKDIPTPVLVLAYGLMAGVVGYSVYRLVKVVRKYNDLKTEEDSADFKNSVESGTTPQINVPSQQISTYSPKPSYSKPVYHPPKQVGQLFPLKRGSKGDLVKDVQEALMKKYGGDILPKYGADGFYGQEMETALVRKGYPTVIDSNDYAKIVLKDSKTDTSKNDDKKDTSKGGETTKFNPKAIAYSLYMSVKNDDVIKALEVLKKIKNKDQYLYVNEEFKKKDIAGSTSMTIATALDYRFGQSKEYKKKINSQLYRIGLKYDGDKWSLSGLGNTSSLVRTISPTTIWDKGGKQFAVPAQKVLGRYIRSKNGICEFETEDGKLFFINAHQISYVS